MMTDDKVLSTVFPVSVTSSDPKSPSHTRLHFNRLEMEA